MLGDYFRYPKALPIKVASDRENIFHFDLYVNNK